MTTDGFTEQALLFGRSRSLVGILARPTFDPTSRRPAVIILNTGIIHRIGHDRMYVTMARQLAAAGHYVLRFDFSGIGDSRSRGGGVSPAAACLMDISEAADLLERSYGAKGFVLIGLCSGADIALQYAGSDTRIVGLALLDPTIPPTARFYAHYIAHRLTRLRSWLSFMRGRGRIWRDLVGQIKSAVTVNAPDDRSILIDSRTRGDLERIYGSLVKRNARLLVVLTGGALQGRQSYREQLLDAFPNVPFAGRLKLEHFKNSDHTFSSPGDRERLNGLTLSWMKTADFKMPDPKQERGAGMRAGQMRFEARKHRG